MKFKFISYNNFNIARKGCICECCRNCDICELSFTIMKILSRQNSLFDECLKMLATCPVCHKQYAQTNAKIVNEIDNAHLLHFRCSYCNSSVVALIFTTGFGITSMGMLTDLDSSDVDKFCQRGYISQDEVLEMYQYLRRERLLNI